MRFSRESPREGVVSLSQRDIAAAISRFRATLRAPSCKGKQLSSASGKLTRYRSCVQRRVRAAAGKCISTLSAENSLAARARARGLYNFRARSRSRVGLSSVTSESRLADGRLSGKRRMKKKEVEPRSRKQKLAATLTRALPSSSEWEKEERREERERERERERKKEKNHPPWESFDSPTMRFVKRPSSRPR